CHLGVVVGWELLKDNVVWSVESFDHQQVVISEGISGTAIAVQCPNSAFINAIVNRFAKGVKGQYVQLVLDGIFADWQAQIKSRGAWREPNPRKKAFYGGGNIGGAVSMMRSERDVCLIEVFGG
ncbi:hypothetical protein BGX33_000441, partial [Mortierella sp. NVP41]